MYKSPDDADNQEEINKNISRLQLRRLRSKHKQQLLAKKRQSIVKAGHGQSTSSESSSSSSMSDSTKGDATLLFASTSLSQGTRRFKPRTGNATAQQSKRNMASPSQPLLHKWHHQTTRFGIWHIAWIDNFVCTSCHVPLLWSLVGLGGDFASNGNCSRNVVSRDTRVEFLRADAVCKELSETCAKRRGVFLPRLWSLWDICVKRRVTSFWCWNVLSCGFLELSETFVLKDNFTELH